MTLVDGWTTPPGPGHDALVLSRDRSAGNRTWSLGTSFCASFGNLESEAAARSPDALFLPLSLAAGGCGSRHTPGGSTGKVWRRADAQRRPCHTECGPGGM